jgi:hypothetical protein
MKFMTSWTPRPATRKDAFESFLAGKAAPLPGVTLLGRWHKADGSGGFTLIETDSAETMYQSQSFWSQFMDMHTVPVIEDAAAGAALTKLYKG